MFSPAYERIDESVTWRTERDFSATRLRSGRRVPGA